MNRAEFIGQFRSSEHIFYIKKSEDHFLQIMDDEQ